MRTFLLLLLAGFVSGCGGHWGFYKPDADHAAFYKDLRECEAEVSPQWQFCTGDACSQMAGEHRRLRNHCMQARGWTLTKKEPKFVP